MSRRGMLRGKPKKKLPKPFSPDAQFCATCPLCLVAGDLEVVSGIFRITGMHLNEDGFAFADASQVETEDERVLCRACERTFPLAEVTR